MRDIYCIQNGTITFYSSNSNTQKVTEIGFRLPCWNGEGTKKGQRGQYRVGKRGERTDLLTEAATQLPVENWG